MSREISKFSLFMLAIGPVPRVSEAGPSIRVVERNSKRVSNPARFFGSSTEPKKRTTGVEPATSSLGSLRSTN